MQKAKFRIIVIRRFEFILSRRNVKKKMITEKRKKNCLLIRIYFLWCCNLLAISVTTTADIPGLISRNVTKRYRYFKCIVGLIFQAFVY